LVKSVCSEALEQNHHLSFSLIYFYREGGELDAGTETNINLNHQIYYHVLGTNQSEDVLCWKDPEHPKYSFGASVTEDGKVTC